MTSLFVRDGARLVPTDHARGPWRPGALHGGAVAALLAGAIDVPGCTPVRVTFDLLAPVPATPLTLHTAAPQGGKRVMRQTVTLLDGDAPVARAQCLAVRRTELDLPEAATGHAGPFTGAPVPDLSRPSPHIRDAIGWDCFDSGAVAIRALRSAQADGQTGLWVRLLLPVVAGEPTPPLSRVAAAADYGSTATNRMLPFDRWSFMNAELSLHVTREPAGTWIGVLSTGIVQPNGCGLGTATLHDSAGPLGRSAQAQVVEART